MSLLWKTALLIVVASVGWKIAHGPGPWRRKPKEENKSPRPLYLSTDGCGDYIEKLEQSHEKACKRKRDLEEFPSGAVARNDKEVLSSIVNEWECPSTSSFGDASSPNSHALCGFEFLSAIPDAMVLSYSVGREDDGFEQALHKSCPKCDIHRFDPTARERTRGVYQVHHWALQGSGVHGGTSAPVIRKERVVSFESSLRTIKREGRRIDVLVLDCTGCEWEILANIFKMIADDDLLVGQLVVKLYIKDKQKDNVANLLETANKSNMKLFGTGRRGACTDAECWAYSFIADWWAAEVHGVMFCPDRVGPMPHPVINSC